MEHRIGKMTWHAALVICLLAGWEVKEGLVFAQETITAKPKLVPTPANLPNIGTEQPGTASTAPVAALTLDECIDIGFGNQPALAAAHASLAAAHSGQSSLHRLPRVANLLSRDLGVRRQQAHLGVTIAEAGVLQTEWETRYSITRNFFSIQYVRTQQIVVDDTLKNLKKGRDRAEKLRQIGNIDYPVTKLDVSAIDIRIELVRNSKAQVDNGMLKALAALREAMGVGCDYPLNIVEVELPPLVYQLDKCQLIAWALANRGEMIQASAASQVTTLEIEAQRHIHGLKGLTFAAGSDIHARPIPQSYFNNEYRPGAIGLEMSTLLVGRKEDRMHRASAFNDRAHAVVTKTHNLISLDVEAMYLKWKEASEEIQNLSKILQDATELPEKVLERDPKNFTSTNVIQANTEAILVRTKLNEARYMYALALAGLERATVGAFRIYPVPSVAVPAEPNKK